MTAQVVKAEETQWGEPETTGISDVQRAVPECHESGSALNLFLQKPSAASPKLSHLSGVAATAADPKKPSNNQCSPNALAATCHPADGTGQGVTENAGAPASSLPGRGPWMTCSPQSFLQEEHFAKAVTEKSGQWFSLLPRSPCDDSSVTSGSSPANSASSPVPLLSASSSSSFPYGQFGAATPPGVKSTHAPTSQVSRRSYALHYLPQFEFLVPATVQTAHSDIKGLSAARGHRHKLKQHKNKSI